MWSLWRFLKMPGRSRITIIVCFTINTACLLFLSFSRHLFIFTFFFQKWHHVVALAIYHEHFPMSLNHLLQNHFLKSAKYVIA